MIGELPQTLVVNGKEHSIRTHFANVLEIISAFDDPELTESEKIYVCLYDLYEDFEDIPEDDFEAAFKAALNFIDMGMKPSDTQHPRTVYWELDEPILFSAINKVAGCEVRSLEYLHWWSFMGYFFEIGEGVYSTILSLRSKKSRGKQLEKWEREYWNANKDICAPTPKLTAEEQAKKDRLNKLLS